MNFRDGKSGNFDKNLTGRLYELGDEVRMVHEHLPHAFMVGIFFLPLDSTKDKTEKANSSFANTVSKLRERAERLDAALPAHAARCDSAFVGLYALGGEEAGVPRGATRFLDVREALPRRGRPVLTTILSMSDVVSRIVERATHSADFTWADPELDD